MIVADREGVRLQLLAALFVVHLVGDARRRRREPRPPLAVALEFIVRYQLLQKLESCSKRPSRCLKPMPPPDPSGRHQNSAIARKPRSTAHATDGILYKSISNPIRKVCVKA
jgi:hypothetical protein